jgi:5'-nucleotidase
LNHPLALKQTGSDWYSLSGTPADCVIFGIRSFLCENDAPDYVFSGINHGANLGTDVVYSGTVAGAREGAIFEKPAIAVSLATEFSSRFDPQPLHFETVTRYLETFLPFLLERSLPPGYLLNINVPNIPLDLLKGGLFTRLGKRIYRDRFIKKTDKEGNELFWLGGEPPTHVAEEGTDFHALESSYVSMTPLRWMTSESKDVELFEDWPSLDQTNGNG